MGFLDRLIGRVPQSPPATGHPGWGTAAPAPTGAPYAAPGADPSAAPAPRGGASTEDERAIARYRYLLRTAPPEDLERVHADAFAQLSPEQRQMVLQRLTEDLPESERPRSDQPADLARSATRAELRRPGYLQGAFAGGRGMGGGMGMGGMIAGSMLGTIAGVVVGSMVADALFDGYDQSPEAAQAGEGDGAADASDADASDAGGGDAGGADAAGTADAGGAGDVSAGGEGFTGGDLGDWGGGGDLAGDFGGDLGGFGDF